MNLVPPWDARSSWCHCGAHRAPVPTHPAPPTQASPMVALGLPSPHLPAPCISLEDECRPLHLLVPVLLLQGNKGVSG